VPPLPHGLYDRVVRCRDHEPQQLPIPHEVISQTLVAVTYARRLHKLGGDAIPTNINDLQMWIEQNIDRVMPVSDEVVERAETVLQEEIVRTMDPTRYEADSIEERNERMLKDAAKIEADIYREHDPEGKKSLHDLVQKIPDAVASHEANNNPRPDGPDKGPNEPNGRGPGGKLRPPAPRPPDQGPVDPAPRPASEGDPTARAGNARTRMIAQIEDMLPKALKPYAKHIAVVCERRPVLLKLSGTSQEALFTALARKAMERHPEVIGGTRAGVQAAKAKRRSRRGRMEIDSKERREEKLRRIEHLRRLEEMHRRRRSARATK
jgi:hypothetical protein